MKVIGLCGYGGVGKDEVGRMLVEDLNYVRFAKGDLIKEAAWKINPMVQVESHNSPASRIHALAVVPTTSVTVVEAIDQLKNTYPQVRDFLQHLADDVVEVLGRDVWNDALWEEIHRWNTSSKRYVALGSRVVLTRLSLPYEVDRLHEEGGKLVRVNRPGFGPANSHPNEVALDGHRPDAVINNNGTLDELLTNVRFVEANLW